MFLWNHENIYIYFMNDVLFNFRNVYPRIFYDNNASLNRQWGIIEGLKMNNDGIFLEKYCALTKEQVFIPLKIYVWRVYKQTESGQRVCYEHDR